ncbi:MAG: LytTR family DNA-binding domain-containing protein [Bacteroidales bacterium]
MRTLIIEDEELAARNLISILNDIGNFEILDIIDSIHDSIKWFKNNKLPDLLFMDVHLADGSSFEIFNHVQVNCPVIFTTAYDEYALNAFKVNSIDYLLKPIDVKDVQKALDKLRHLTDKNITANEIKNLLSAYVSERNFKTHFLVKHKGDKLLPLQASDIAYSYIDAGIVKSVTFENKTYVMDYKLDELINLLESKNFFRVNRQYIISRKAIKDIDLWFNSRLSVNLTIPTPEKLLISKARIQEFRNWFGS